MSGGLIGICIAVWALHLVFGSGADGVVVIVGSRLTWIGEVDGWVYLCSKDPWACRSLEGFGGMLWEARRSAIYQQT